jgi:DNA-binding NarL/FixJ family response regulator
MGVGEQRLNLEFARHARREKSYENTDKQFSLVSMGNRVLVGVEESHLSAPRRPSGSAERDDHGGARTGATDGDRIAIIESRIFLRECIRRGMQASFSLPLDTYENIAELRKDARLPATRLVMICWSSHDKGRGDENASCILAVSELLPGAPIVVLANRQAPELAQEAITVGAKGYIPMSVGFDIAVEAVRFVLAGGTYVPAEYILAKTTASTIATSTTNAAAMTAREMLVVRAIQQGKPNKIIAYELNMCESTVKVHVRNIMKKLGAKNRTAVAMKANEFEALSWITSK